MYLRYPISGIEAEGSCLGSRGAPAVDSDGVIRDFISILTLPVRFPTSSWWRRSKPLMRLRARLAATNHRAGGIPNKKINSVATRRTTPTGPVTETAPWETVIDSDSRACEFLDLVITLLHSSVSNEARLMPKTLALQGPDGSELDRKSVV